METKNEKNEKFYFILKQKSNVPFDPPKVPFNFHFKIGMKKAIFKYFKMRFKIEN